MTINLHGKIACATLLAFASLAPACQAQKLKPETIPTATEALLYSFCSPTSCPEGYQPRQQLIQAADGNFYGTTFYLSDGNPAGTIFRVTPSGVLTVIYTFQPGEGDPNTPLMQGMDGNLYGATFDGELYRVSFDGEVSFLLQVPLKFPWGDLVQDRAGNIYGVTESGGTHEYGTIYELSADGTFSTVYNFGTTSSDGAAPFAGLVQGSDGNFYGTTSEDGEGNGGEGTVFQFVPGTGVVNTIAQFPGSVNYFVQAGLVEGSDGNFYGVTTLGGAGGGVFFQVTPAGVLTSLANLEVNSGLNREDGTPFVGSDGNFYDTVVGEGGNDGYAFQFQLTGPSSGNLYDLHDFGSGNDGVEPGSGVVQASDGSFYGDTIIGGAYNFGSFFKLTMSPTLAPPVQVSGPATASVGHAATFSYKSLNSFSLTMQECNGFATNQTTGMLYPMGPLPGTLNGGVYSGTFTAVPPVVGTYLVAVTCGGIETGTTNVTVVQPIATTTTVVPSLPTVTSGQTENFTITVTPASGSAIQVGSVSLKCGGYSLGSMPIANDTANFTVNTAGVVAGVDSCTANYVDPSSAYLPSSGSTSITVLKQSSSIALTSETSDCHQGGQVTLLATVTGEYYTPQAGTVTFSLGQHILAVLPISANGQATYTFVANDPVGNYTITATYSGTAGTSGSSTSATFTLNPASDQSP